MEEKKKNINSLDRKDLISRNNDKEVQKHHEEHRHEHEYNHEHQHENQYEHGHKYENELEHHEHHEHNQDEQNFHSHEYESHHHENAEHPHKHHHEDTKKVLNRMSRAIGHMEAIKRMIEDERDCSEVLIQIAAVKSAINNVGKMILQDHINHCVVDALETGDQKVLDDLADAIDKFVK